MPKELFMSKVEYTRIFLIIDLCIKSFLEFNVPFLYIDFIL